MRTSLLLIASVSLALGQQYSITTVAGGAPAPTPATATNAAIGRPARVTVDSTGNVYFSSSQSVYKLASNGALTLLAGNGRTGFSGDGGPAVRAQLNEPKGLAVDAAGNLYIADSGNNRVRIVDKNGVINTFAGTGATSFGGGPGTFNDEGPATNAFLHLPSGVAVDKNGVVYIADTGDNIIRTVTTDGIIHTFAGDSYAGYFDRDPATAIYSEFNKPSDVAVDGSGNVYIADTTNQVIRKVDTSGLVSTIAGDTSTGYKGDNGAATSAGLVAPTAVVVDGSGNLYIMSSADGRVRKVDTKGIITTVAGNGTSGFADGSDATKAQFFYPSGLAIDGSGNLYVADTQNMRIRKIAGATVSTVAGNGVFSYSGDGGPALAAQLSGPLAVAADASGNIYIADTANNALRRVSKDGTITNVLGNGQPGSGDNQLSAPQAVTVDAAGNLYVADTTNSRVRRIGASGGVANVGGTDQFFTPSGVAVDSAGNVYVPDLARNIVKKVATDGTVAIVAGNGGIGYGGDNGDALKATLNAPRAVAVDTAGNLYIADTGNNRIRKVNGGQISTVAGTGVPGFSGDAGMAVNAQIAGPVGLAADASGNLYFSDGTHIRKVFASGLITTIAGTNSIGYSGDGGAALSAQLNSPAGVAVDSTGNVYFADSGNNAVRRLQPIASGLRISAVTGGATNQTGVIAPGEVLALYGSGMGPAQVTPFQLTNGSVPTTVGGTTVYINGTPAPILYTSQTQVGVVAPFGISGNKADVVVTYQGQVSAALTVSIADTAPGLFTLNASGSGQAVALNQNGDVNDANHPAKAGEYVTLYATGTGRTNPASQDGVPATAPYPLPVAPISVTIGGQNATVQYAGAAPAIVAGVTQVNVQIPTGLTAGAVPVVLKAGASSSPNGVTIYVQ